MRARWLGVLAWLGVVACTQGAPTQNPRTQNARPADGVPAPRSLPLIGLAVSPDPGSWCAEFPADASGPSLETGRPVTLVFPGQAPIASVGARIEGVQPGECHAEFPQSRWDGYHAYRIALSSRSDAVNAQTVALIVTGESRWLRGDEGVVRADLDGDGTPEEARRCAADEGEHFTIWSVRTGNRERRAHEYFDWGALVDRTCQPGEDGR